MILKEFKCLNQEIVEVHRVSGLLFLSIAFLDFFDFLKPLLQMGVAEFENVLDRLVGVLSEAKDGG